MFSFSQIDKQASDSDIPATTCPVTVGDESLAEGSTSRRQSLFVAQDSEESDESSSLDNELTDAAKSLLIASGCQSSTSHVIRAVEYSAQTFETQIPTESSTMYIYNASCPGT